MSEESTKPGMKRQKSEKKKGTKVVNDTISTECKLSSDEQFGKVFHPKIKKAYTDGIPLFNGKEFCHKFHSLGFCHDLCQFKESHVLLDNNTQQKWVKFVKFCRCKATSGT